MLDRRPSPQADPGSRRRPTNHLRSALALVVVVAALLAVAALLKRDTCTCNGSGVPYATIAVGSAVTAVAAFAVYVATGLSRRRS
jgi:hypothetical protein